MARKHTTTTTTTTTTTYSFGPCGPEQILPAGKTWRDLPAILAGTAPTTPAASTTPAAPAAFSRLTVQEVSRALRRAGVEPAAGEAMMAYGQLRPLLCTPTAARILRAMPAVVRGELAARRVIPVLPALPVGSGVLAAGSVSTVAVETDGVGITLMPGKSIPLPSGRRAARRSASAAPRAARLPAAPSKPGVIASIEAICRAAAESGTSVRVDDIHAALLTAFPDRRPEHLMATVKAQVPSRLCRERGLAFARIGAGEYTVSLA